MTELWDPVKVLRLPIYHNCVGWAAHDRKCAGRLNKDNVVQIEAIVQAMSQLLPHSKAVHPLLTKLALCGLCKTFHRDQHEKMIDEWGIVIRRYRAKQAAQRHSSFKQPDQESVSEMQIKPSGSSRSTPERPSPLELHVAEPFLGTIVVQGAHDVHLAEDSLSMSAVPGKYYLVLSGILMAIIVAALIGSPPQLSSLLPTSCIFKGSS
ncbi:hypothetical protein DE146DRAFT_396264 [Phaeosphaeria sp. MPI-PUGE-AT-0046c]|nr:hypothetical protein DE146DRAFT_396264 [Phaeosphaeria sp. MPI-PUGE-AT-0046c]